MHEQSSDPKHIAEQIAEAIVDHLHTHGQCSIMDVKAMGFSLNDIARNWPDACKIAERARPRVFP
jgi:hypothetical protein